jgi:CPA2 family monovalent cation:H+ antiporter-2
MMPKPLQTFLALYGSWIENLGRRPREMTRGGVIRHFVRLLVLDVVLLAALAIGTSVAMGRISAFVEGNFGLNATISRIAVIATAVALAVPLCTGVVRVARRLGATLASVALPPTPHSAHDLAAAPRRALVVTLQLLIVLLAGLPLLAITQPFLGGVYGLILFALLLFMLGVAIWRGATDLQGRVRTGAQTIVEALIAQARSGGVSVDADSPPSERDALEQVRAVLPGLGDPTPVRLDERSHALGKTLAELNLRGITGATVLAITRLEGGLLVPTAKETLRAGDVLALAGTGEAVEAARALLSGSGERAALSA